MNNIYEVIHLDSLWSIATVCNLKERKSARFRSRLLIKDAHVLNFSQRVYPTEFGCFLVVERCGPSIDQTDVIDQEFQVMLPKLCW
jgi:hypothetical protein